MGNKNRNRVKKSISPFVKWGKWGGDGVKAFVYAIIFTIVGSDGTSSLFYRFRIIFSSPPLCDAYAACSTDNRGSPSIIWRTYRIFHIGTKSGMDDALLSRCTFPRQAL